MTIERRLNERLRGRGMVWAAVFAVSVAAYVVLTIGQSYWGWNTDLTVSLPILAVGLVALLLAVADIGKRRKIKSQPEPGDDPARWAGNAVDARGKVKPSKGRYLFWLGTSLFLTVVYLGMGLDTLLRHLDGNPTLNIVLGLAWLFMFAVHVRRYLRDYPWEGRANA